MKIHTFYKDGLQLIEVKNDLNLKVIFCDLGASVFNVYFHDELMTRNVKNIKDFKNPNCYYGKTIGRTSNRLKGHQYRINNVIYQLENNEGSNVLHGGNSGLSNQRFTSVVNVGNEYVDIVYSYFSKHLESGYPGNVNFKVTYRVYNHEEKFDVYYFAVSDMNTLLSLTNHSYFCLGDKDLSNIELMINGKRYLNVDKSNLLAKDIREVNQLMDFSSYKSITKNIDSPFLKGKMMNGYDTFYYFDEKDKELVNVSIRNKKYQLDIKTDFEGTQIYTSNYPTDFELNGDVCDFRDSVAIEPSDSFLKPRLFSKDKEYSRMISYRFIKLK